MSAAYVPEDMAVVPEHDSEIPRRLLSADSVPLNCAL
jgi:hypothetical protein